MFSQWIVDLLNKHVYVSAVTEWSSSLKRYEMPQERIQALEEKIAYLENNVSEITGTLVEFEKAITALAVAIENYPDSTSATERAVGSDRVWNCEKCGARLGVYDPDSDQLRIKYKDFSLYSVPGKGGSLTVPCRRCAHLNTLEDDR